jgi:hypothetical protein
MASFIYTVLTGALLSFIAKPVHADDFSSFLSTSILKTDDPMLGVSIALSSDGHTLVVRFY